MIDSDRPPEVPSLLGERYRIERRIGRGGMGRVMAATDVQSGDRVAVKLLHPGLTSVERTVERLRREAKILHDLDHPGIVKLLDCGRTPDNSIFVTMELLEGETLQQRLVRDGSVPWPEMVRILIAICDALGTAHGRDVVHRDVKPSNIFLTPRDGRPAKLIDFGIAVAFHLERLTLTGDVVGSPGWMAPEQLLSSKDVDLRADVYSLGLVAWSAISGQQAFTGSREEVLEGILKSAIPPLSEHVPDVPAELSAALARATSREAKNRQPDALALAIDAGPCIGIQLERTTPRKRRWTLQETTSEGRISFRVPRAQPGEGRWSKARIVTVVGVIASIAVFLGFFLGWLVYAGPVP